MAYERLNLPKGTVLKEHHIAHIENGIVNLEAKASEIESVAVQQSYDEGYETGYKSGYDIGEQLGHQEGVAEGWQQGLDEGVVIGKEQQYDAFWDAYQQNGTREVYEYAFAGYGWNNDTLNPKHPICPTFASNLFLNCMYVGDLRDLRVTFNFSQSQTISNLFGYFGGLTAVGDIDTTSSPTCTALFIKDRALVTIEKLILKYDGSQTFTNCFLNNDSLRNIAIVGVIGQDIDFQHSTKLSKASIVSIIEALKTLKTNESRKILTLSKTAVNAIDWSNTVVNNVTCNTFDEVANTKSTWTISLV